MPNSKLRQATWRGKNEMYSVKNIGRAAGFLYVFIDIFGPLSILYVPTNSSHAATAWLAVSSVLEVLVNRIEVLGGIWVLLVTWGALLVGRLPRTLNYLGVVIGVAGLVTIVPALEVLGIGFRVGEILWGLWLGIIMLRGSQRARSAAVRKTARKLHAFFVARLSKLFSVSKKEYSGALEELADAGDTGAGDTGVAAPVTDRTYPLVQPLAQPLGLSVMPKGGTLREKPLPSFEERGIYRTE
jgi:hypothetical protein